MIFENLTKNKPVSRLCDTFSFIQLSNSRPTAMITIGDKN